MARTFSIRAATPPSLGTWAKLTARDSLGPRLDWLCCWPALALSFIGSLLVWSATRNRTELNHGDPYYFLLHHVLNTGIGLALAVGTHLARPPHPARRGPGPLRALGVLVAAGPHPAGRHHQRLALLAGDPRRLLPPARRVREDHHHPRHGDDARRPGRRRRPPAPRPPHRHAGAGPGRRPGGGHPADARPRLGHGPGRDHPGRAARLRRLQPLDPRPAGHGRRRRRPVWQLGLLDDYQITRFAAFANPASTRPASATTPTRRASPSAAAG